VFQHRRWFDRWSDTSRAQRSRRALARGVINVKLGEFERLVLLVVQKLDDNAYSVTIQKAIEEVTEKPQSVPQLYVALSRLVGKGALSERLGSPTRVRGGRAKRLYRVTAEGSAALEQAEIAERNRAAALKRVVGAFGGG
jgi:PadR family transcriptional regulator PadR